MLPFDEKKYPASKRIGVSSEVTLVTRIKSGRVEGEYRTYRKRLEDVLDDVQWRESQGLETPVGLLRQIHFARWVIIERPGSEADLLFASNFDGDMKHYFRTFSLQLTGDIDRVWQNCEGYPGARDFDRLWQYVKDHQIQTRLFYSAYPTVTMPRVKMLAKLNEAGEEAPALAFAALAQSLQRGPPPVAPRQPPFAAHANGPPTTLDQAEIQANILGSPPWEQAEYRFFNVEDPAKFRTALGRLAAAGSRVGFITAADYAQSKQQKALTRSLNIAFSWRGLEQLGAAKAYRDAMPLPFREGMAERAEILGDEGEAAPAQWQGMLGHSDVHVVISAFAMGGDLKDYWRQIRECASEQADAADSPHLPGCKMVHREQGQRREGGYEAFGFRDGIGQPVIAGLDRANGDDAIAPGEFILGYGDIDHNDQIAESTVGPSFRSFCLNGTYMVFRKIEQNVDAFQAAAGVGDVAARLFGRRTDGSSLAVADPETATALSNRQLDDFHYNEDADGLKCPVGSHARRINPRTPEARRHRIIRRGIPYADPVDKSVGMLFVCFNARIDSQFEFLQSEWCRKGDFLGGFTQARDPIIGGGGLFFDPKDVAPRRLESFAIVRGGEYLFVPGMTALRGLASGAFDTAPTDAVASEIRGPAPTADQTFDPVERLKDTMMAETLLNTRDIEKREVAWASGKRQAVYYVACRDHVEQILKNDMTFPSAYYADKLAKLLAGYEFKTWLRSGETTPVDLHPLRRFMLGMTSADEEKQKRLAILKQAMGGASDLDRLRAQIGQAVEPFAEDVASQVIATAGKGGGFDVVQLIAYGLPLANAHVNFGYPTAKVHSEAYKTVYFERPSIEEARAVGFLRLFKDGPDLPPELSLLAQSIAIFLLIDFYNTPEALQFARVAVNEMLNQLGAEAKAEEDRIAAGAPRKTLLSRLLQCRPAGVDAATHRIRIGMIVAEFVVGGFVTAATGIAKVVDNLLSHSVAMDAARAAITERNDAKLNAVILEILRVDPVAPVIVRSCPDGASLQVKGAPVSIEAGSLIFLLMRAAMMDPFPDPLLAKVGLEGFVFDGPPEVQSALDRLRPLVFGDGAHGCLGTETVLAEIRGVLKQLLALPQLRRAAGPAGRLQLRTTVPLPVALHVRFGP